MGLEKSSDRAQLAIITSPSIGLHHAEQLIGFTGADGILGVPGEVNGFHCSLQEI